MSLLLQGLEVGFGVGTLKLKSLILIRVTIASKIKEINCMHPWQYILKKP